MPDIKEKLVELLNAKVYDDWYSNEEIADHLIANGVTILESSLKVLESATDTNVGCKWISVDERLPKGCNGEDLSENVIAYLNNGEIAEVCTGWCNVDQWWLIVGDRDTHTSWGMGAVTHWMPLPEPPAEEVDHE